MTRRESTDKRHKRIRSKVSLGSGARRRQQRQAGGAEAASGPAVAHSYASLSFAQVEGTPERPRLAVFRSNNHIYAQVGAGATCVRPRSTQSKQTRLTRRCVQRPGSLSCAGSASCVYRPSRSASVPAGLGPLALQHKHGCPQAGRVCSLAAPLAPVRSSLPCPASGD